MRMVVASLLILSYGVFSAEAAGVYGNSIAISPKQDLELMRKSWNTHVNVDFKNKTLEEVIQDFSRQSGTTIRLVDKPPNSTGPSTPVDYNLGIFIDEQRAEYFLGADLAREETWARALRIQGSFTRLECARPVSLAPLLDLLARLGGLVVSYRKDEIVLGTTETLLPELLVAYSVRLTKGGWGSIFRFNVNNEAKSVRISIEDAVALDMLRSSRVQIQNIDLYGDPTGIASKMRAVKPELDVHYDSNSKTIFMRGSPEMVSLGRRRFLRELDTSAPDGPEFRSARLKLWANAAWAKLDADRCAQLGQMCIMLDSPKFSEREQAVKDLIASAPASVFLLFSDKLRDASLEAQLRAKIVLEKVYGDEELKLVRPRAEEYLRLLGNGDVAILQENYWDKDRIVTFNKFASQRNVMKQAAQANDKKVGEKLGDDGMYSNGIKIDEPKLERIQLSGSVACITFSTTSMAEIFKVERTVSHFFMVFDGKMWIAGPRGTELPLENDPITWTVENGLPTKELDPSGTKIVTGHNENGKGQKSVSHSYAADFGL